MNEQPRSAPSTDPSLSPGADEAADLAGHLARVRALRAELAESLRAVDDALAAAAPDDAWPERVAAALAELGHDLRDHVEITEGERGLYARVRHSAPRLATPIERLRSEHPRHREQVEHLLAGLERDGAAADLATVRAEVGSLVTQLRAHRQRGRDLVHEAYDIDLGGSG